MLMDHLTDRMRSASYLSAKQSAFIDTMINFHGEGNVDGDGDGTSKRALTQPLLWYHQAKHLEISRASYSFTMTTKLN